MPNWDDIAWIRRLWDKRLVLKGIMDAEDARRAVDAGADAIVVSNHGGRQLDGAPSSIRMLPTIAKAVKGQTEVWFDGGIRSGQDVLRAIGLGARGTMIGRAFLYGLGAMGEAGVRLCLEIIEKESFTREYLDPKNRDLKSRVDAESITRTQRLEPAPPFPAYARG